MHHGYLTKIQIVVKNEKEITIAGINVYEYLAIINKKKKKRIQK